jgi:hypothetical protein
MIRRFFAVVASLAVTAPVVVALTAAQAGANVEISFVERQTNTEFVVNGATTLQPPAALQPGDRIIFRSDLLQGSTTIGFDNGFCTVEFNDNALCEAVFAITGKGDFTAIGLLRGLTPSVFDIAVTGGTFAYRNAHGDAHVVQVNSTDANWTLNLVTG